MRKLTDIEAAVCFKLYRNRCFGKGHMLLDHMVRGFPRHAVEDARAAAEELLRAGILVRKATRHGAAVFVHPRLRAEVYRAIREHPAYRWLPP